MFKILNFRNLYICTHLTYVARWLDMADGHLSHERASPYDTRVKIA